MDTLRCYQPVTLKPLWPARVNDFLYKIIFWKKVNHQELLQKINKIHKFKKSRIKKFFCFESKCFMSKFFFLLKIQETLLLILVIWLFLFCKTNAEIHVHCIEKIFDSINRCSWILGFFESYNNEIHARWWARQYLHVFHVVDFDDSDVLCATEAHLQNRICPILRYFVSGKKSNHFRTSWRCRIGMLYNFFVTFKRFQFYSNYHSLDYFESE